MITFGIYKMLTIEIELSDIKTDSTSIFINLPIENNYD